ncbi:hypothetical protein [Leptospira noguchii]|uniref:hypothetical protein n=1 Tax=Leptospira noguchii TaxID=28182 RepID=UPI003D75AEDB
MSSFRSNSFGISATIAFAFVTLNSVILTNMSLTSEKSWNLNLVDRFLKCGTTANRDCTNKF